ncbi:NTP transferase domain-containing protein [bacterium]|nr:NTP transferase domain-containing protein [bacterium]
MKAVIMAGGFGTRLRPLTCNIPKPMVPVANKPMMEHIVNLLKKYGITEIVSLLYYQPEKIKNYFGDGSKFGIKMDYVKAEADFGTAGSVKNAAHLLKERFIIISGDVLTDFDLEKAIKFHEEKKSISTILLTRVTNPLAFGVVITDDKGKITRFLEKPSWGEVFSDTINTGIYILEPEALDFIPPKMDFDFSKNLFPIFLKEQKGLYGYISEGYWRDIGNLDEYIEAHKDLLNGQVKIPTLPGNTSLIIDKTAKIGENVSFEGMVIIGKNAEIGDNVEISYSIIGDNSKIGNDSVINSSVVWDNVKTEEDIGLKRDVVCSRVSIGKKTRIHSNVFVAEDCKIGKEAIIKQNLKLWPDKIVHDNAIVTSSLIWGDKWLRELFTDAKVVGLINSEISPDFGAKLGGAYGAFIGLSKNIIVSRDSYDGSRMINRALMSGLMSAGVNCVDVSELPIPVIRHQLRSGGYAGGVHTRKSTLGDKSVEIIFIDNDGKDIPVSKAKSIERLFQGEDFSKADFESIGQVEFSVRVTESYKRNFFKNLDTEAIDKRKFKVVIDYSNGSASNIFPSLLGSLDCQIISLNAYTDQRKLIHFRNFYEPAKAQLSSIVKSVNADLGFLIDPSAEKVFLVNETGEYIDTLKAMLVVTELFLKQNQGIDKIAVPVTATNKIDEIAKKYGVTEVIRTKNDHSSMMDSVINKGAKFVSGTRGGYIFPEFLFACDGMFAMAKIMELLAKDGRNFSDFTNEGNFFHTSKKSVPCPWEKKGTVMRKIMEFSEPYERQLIDGVKVFLNETEWVLLIPDRLEAFFNIYAESNDAKRTKEIVREFEQKLLTWSE